MDNYLKTLDMPKNADTVTYEVYQVEFCGIPINNVFYTIERTYEKGCTTPIEITSYCNECIGDCTTVIRGV